MAEQIIDCRTLPCPEPVIKARECLAASAPEALILIVDNEPAVENVSRFLRSRGYTVTETRSGDLYRVSGMKDPNAGPNAEPDLLPCPAPQSNGRTLVVISSPLFGQGDDGLGRRLMSMFLKTLPEMGSDLWRVVLLNGGVTLSAEGDPAVEHLKVLEASGTDVFVCGTCLEHFGLTQKKAVGQTTNMLDIVTAMQLAGKVVKI